MKNNYKINKDFIINMIEITLYYIKDKYDIFNIEDGYLLLEHKKYFPVIDYQEDYNLFTFIIDENIKYTMKINLNNNFYDCFTQSLFRNDEELHPLEYKINFEEIEHEEFTIDEEDSYG
jgi:hypothetical protein